MSSFSKVLDLLEDLNEDQLKSERYCCRDGKAQATQQKCNSQSKVECG